MNHNRFSNSANYPMYNGIIMGCSLLTFGMITSTYLHGIMNLHMTHKIYNQQNMKYNDYYWYHFLGTFVLAISGVSFVMVTLGNRKN